MEFTGMALYSKEDINKALIAFKHCCDEADRIITNKLSEAERTYKPSWLTFWRGKSLREWYDSKESYDTYFEWVRYNTDYIKLTDSEYNTLVVTDRISTWCFDYVNEYNSVFVLSNNGEKECYLNPRQAEFVNNFKNKEVTNALSQ